MAPVSAPRYGGCEAHADGAMGARHQAGAAVIALAEIPAGNDAGNRDAHVAGVAERDGSRGAGRAQTLGSESKRRRRQRLEGSTQQDIDFRGRGYESRRGNHVRQSIVIQITHGQKTISEKRGLRRRKGAVPVVEKYRVDKRQVQLCSGLIT
jgi:hypothetical protein